VLRVDRIEAKLTMYRDIIAMDRAMTPALLGPNAPVWAVAVGGDLRAYNGDIPVPLNWGVWFLDGQTGKTIGFTTDSVRVAGRTWPSFWDDLVDRR